MKSYIQKDFSGGMVDEWDDCGPRYCQRLRNMLLDANGKPYVRNGTVRWGSVAKLGAPVSDIRIMKDLSQIGSQAYFKALAYITSGHLYDSWVGGAISETVGPATWNEIIGIGTGYTFNFNGALRAKSQFANSHMYYSFQDQTPRSDYLDFPKPRKVFADSNLIGANVGLPAYTDNTFSVVPTAGTHTYLYYVVYKFTWLNNGVTFVIRGTPSPAFTVASAHIVDGGNPAAVSSIVYPNAATHHDLYPLLNNSTTYKFAAEVYRTIADGSVPLFCKEVAYNVTSFSDTLTDAALGSPLYTNDGTAAFDEPMPCQLMHVVGNFAYYGGFDVPVNLGGSNVSKFPFGFVGAIQSSPGVIESAPGSFTIATPAHLTAIESIDYYPIFFSLFGCWRVEGQIDAYGNGTPILRTISERVGAIHQQGVIKTDRGLIFAAVDGIYFTDGFSVKKLSDHLNKWYRTWWNFHKADAVQRMSGAYAPAVKKFFMSGNLQTSPGTSGSATTANAILVGDMRQETDPSVGEPGVATSYLDGQSGALGNQFSFNPACLMVYNNYLFFGDQYGYIQAMNIQSAVSSDYVQNDFASDSTLGNIIFPLPVVFDYLSASIDFGNRMVKKWVTWVFTNFKLPFGPTYGQTTLYAQVVSHNDNSFVSDTNNNGATLAVIADTVPAYRRFWRVFRSFAQGQIRCFTKQIQIKSAYVVLLASKPGGTRAYSVGTLDRIAKTLTGVSPLNGFTSSMVNAALYLSQDGYVKSWLIAAVQTDGCTVIDPGNTLPVNGTYEWMVQGYPLLPGTNTSIDSFAIGYDELEPGHERVALATDNVVNK